MAGEKRTVGRHRGLAVDKTGIHGAVCPWQLSRNMLASPGRFFLATLVVLPGAINISDVTTCPLLLAHSLRLYWDSVMLG